jgi:hypothetical protein
MFANSLTAIHGTNPHQFDHILIHKASKATGPPSRTMDEPRNISSPFQVQVQVQVRVKVNMHSRHSERKHRVQIEC